MEQTNHCKNCGICCKTIPLTQSLSEIKAILSKDPNNYDAEFILKYFQPITKEKANQLNPDLGRELSEEDIKKGIKKKSNFYICLKLQEDGKCGAYNERPNLCKVYPYNNHLTFSIKDILINKTTCGFIPYAEESLKKEEGPFKNSVLNKPFKFSEEELQKIESIEDENYDLESPYERGRRLSYLSELNGNTIEKIEENFNKLKGLKLEKIFIDDMYGLDEKVIDDLSKKINKTKWNCSSKNCKCHG